METARWWARYMAQKPDMGSRFLHCAAALDTFLDALAEVVYAAAKRGVGPDGLRKVIMSQMAAPELYGHRGKDVPVRLCYCGKPVACNHEAHDDYPVNCPTGEGHEDNGTGECTNCGALKSEVSQANADYRAERDEHTRTIVANAALTVEKEKLAGALRLITKLGEHRSPSAWTTEEKIAREALGEDPLPLSPPASPSEGGTGAKGRG